MTSVRPPPASTATLERQADSKGSPRSSVKSQCFGLTFSRGWLVHVAEESVRISQQGIYQNRKGEEVDVTEALRHSVENSVHYHSSHVFNSAETTQKKFDGTNFQVQYGSSLEVASRLRKDLSLSLSVEDFFIGVLNSASGKNPNKFLRGTLSQEEGILRASLLYPCLLQYADRPHHFYYINQKPKYQDSTSSCAIFSPRVPVIREDTLKGYLLDNYETFSFVSIPAPNAFALGSGGVDEKDEAVVPRAQAPGSSERSEPYDVMSIQSAMHDRIFRALSIFAEQGCTDLVLCAFGCGVHGNDPKEIATCFRDVLTKELHGRFRTVVFAINPSRYQNFEEFVQVFGDEAGEPNP
jgi:uncharacterized protein (TIGR02452 family)